MTVPEWFKTRLKDTDPQLVVYFNPFKRRWIIDRRTEDGQTTNVMVCESDTGEPLELSDNIIDRLRSMDAWKKHGTYEAFHRHNINLAAADKEKREAEIRESYHHAALDDKSQLHKAFDLIQRHDVHRVNQ